MTQGLLNSSLLLMNHLGWMLAGIALGIGYFVMVRHSATMLVSGGGTIRIIALLMARICLVAAGLYLASRHGTLPLLAETAGIIVGRQIVLRRKSGAAS